VIESQLRLSFHGRPVPPEVFEKIGAPGAKGARRAEPLNSAPQSVGYTNYVLWFPRLIFNPFSGRNRSRNEWVAECRSARRIVYAREATENVEG
jgi:hypothetical protein